MAISQPRVIVEIDGISGKDVLTHVVDRADLIYWVKVTEFPKLPVEGERDLARVVSDTRGTHFERTEQIEQSATGMWLFP
jgi:hypothetical protein